MKATTQKWKKIEDKTTEPAACVSTNAWDCHQFVKMTDDEALPYERASLATAEWNYGNNNPPKPGPFDSTWWTSEKTPYATQYESTHEEVIYHQKDGNDAWG